MEGIVQKRRDSLYHEGRRSKDWVKVKNLIDEDFVACGYIMKSPLVTSVVLGAFENGRLVYRGHVTLGVSRDDALRHTTSRRCPFTEIPPGNEDAVWYDPLAVCTVTYMTRTSAGGMRQPRFKGFRQDMSIDDLRLKFRLRH